VVEGLARRNHSNRSRLRRDAGANSSKVVIPWKIRSDWTNPSPFLSTKKGLFYYREGVKAMDSEDSMGDADTDMQKKKLFKAMARHHGKSRSKSKE